MPVSRKVNITTNGSGSQFLSDAGTYGTPAGGTDIFLPETYGALGNGIHDDTTAIQAAIAAAAANGGGIVQFSAKTYLITATLTITASNVCLAGVMAGTPAAGGPSGSIITCNSATVDMLNVGNGGTQVFANLFSNLCLTRSVTPTTGNGFVMDSVVDAKLNNIWVFDSIYCFYHKNAQFNTYTNCYAEWTSTSNGITGYGFKMVGTNTTGFFSTRVLEGVVINKTSSGTFYGMHISTSSNGVADLYCDGFETASTNYGIYIDGTSSNFNENLHFLRTIHDANSVSCIYITGLHGHDSYVEINGGYVTPIGSGAAIDIENSAGVIVSNVNFLALNAGSGPCVLLNGANSKNNIVSNNIMYCANSAQVVVKLNGANGNNVSDNTIVGAAASFTTGISLLSSSYNTVEGNTLSGGGTTGISLDAASGHNGGVNVVDPTSITTPLSDSGTGNFVTIAGGGGSGTVTHTGSLTSNAVILGNGTADIKPGAVLPGNASLFYDGTGNFSTPGGGGGGSVNSLFSKKYYTTSQRALNSVYQNTTGQPIIVAGWALGNNVNAQVLTDSSVTPTTVVLDQYAQSGYGWNFMFMVKAGDYYEVSISGGTPISWVEWEIVTGSVTFSGDLSGSRALSTVYQNTSGKAMLVLVDLSSVGSGTNVQGISDSNASPTDVVYNADGVSAGSHTFWMMVPNNHYYKVTCSGAAVQHWNEYSLPFNATKSADLAVAQASRKLQISAGAATDGIVMNGQCKDLFVSISDAPSQTGSLIVDAAAVMNLGFPYDNTTMSNNNSNHSACAIFVVLGEFYSARQDAGSPSLVHWWEYALS